MMCTTTTEEFIAYKSARGHVITLKIPVGSRTNLGRKDVVNPNRAKFRTDKATVLEIRNKETGEFVVSVFSDYDQTFQYIVGEDVEPTKEYEAHPDWVCASGIHIFLTNEAAYDYDRDVENGLYQQWLNNGTLIVTGTTKHGHKDGEWTYYYDNGKPHTLTNWVDGKKSGLSKTWEEDGFLKSMEIYRKDRPTIGIVYKDKHSIFIEITSPDNSFVRREFRRETKLTPEDQINHENQLLTTGDLILSSDYEPV